MIPEFICLKYAGVHSPAQMLSDKIGIGWKCRKYQRWTDIHVENGDREILKAVGDGLIDHDVVLLEHFGRISEIFLNVQRWRYDKEKLSVDPPHESLWDKVDNEIALGEDALAFVKKTLGALGISTDATDSGFARAVVIFEQILSMAEGQELLECDRGGTEIAVAFESKSAWLSYARDHVAAMYTAVGTDPPESSSIVGVLQSVCRDIGLCKYQEIAEKDLSEIVVTDSAKKIVIRHGQLPERKLFSIDYAQGIVVVTLNDNHSFIHEVLKEDHSSRLFHQLVYAYAKSANAMVGASDDIDRFTSYLGLSLSRVTDGVDSEYKYDEDKLDASES